MILTIDPTACAGHGLCYYTAPELVTADENGYGVIVGDGTIPDSERAVAEQAVSLCPEQALHLLSRGTE
jgi:ferredoxin